MGEGWNAAVSLFRSILVWSCQEDRCLQNREQFIRASKSLGRIWNPQQLSHCLSYTTVVFQPLNNSVSPGFEEFSYFLSLVSMPDLIEDFEHDLIIGNRPVLPRSLKDCALFQMAAVSKY